MEVKIQAAAGATGAGHAGDPGALSDAEPASLAGLYRMLIEHVVDYAIFLLDPAGYVRSWNPGARRIKGYEAEEIIGRHFSIFYPEEDRGSGRAERALGIAAREGHFLEENWRVRKDGSRFWASVVITALRDEAGNLLGFAKITRDLTERLAAERRALEQAANLARQETARQLAEERAAELARLLDRVHEQAIELDARRHEAEQANRAKGAFLAAVSHELRTPLNAIGGYTDLLLLGVHGKLTPTQRQDLVRIWKSQRRLLALINDLLSFARLEAGRLDYAFKVVDVDNAVASALEIIEPEAAARRHRVLVSAAAPRLAAFADPDRLEQILLNLLSNAIKFTAPGGRITIRANATDDRVRILVADNGPGIPPERIEEIFKPFTQLRNHAFRVIEGTGLGLAISSELARGMGGSLTAQSRVGVGSTFILELPKPPANGAAEPIAASGEISPQAPR